MLTLMTDNGSYKIKGLLCILSRLFSGVYLWCTAMFIL